MTTETIVTESTQQIINANLQDALSLVIEKTMQGVDASVDFLQQEIPDVIYQLILRYGVKSAVEFAVGLLLILPVVWYIRRYIVECDMNCEKRYISIVKDNDKEPTALGLQASLVTISTVVGLMLVNLEWLQIWIALKIWLLEYASNFIK